MLCTKGEGGTLEKSWRAVWGRDIGWREREREEVLQILMLPILWGP